VTDDLYKPLLVILSETNKPIVSSEPMEKYRWPRQISPKSNLVPHGRPVDSPFDGRKR
jgi:hypothetical protein